MQSVQVPRWGADEKREYRDEHLPNEDPARYRRLRRIRTGRLRAVDLADATHSELHVVHVGVVPIFLKSYPGVLGYERRLDEQIEEMSRELLRKQSWRVKAAGGTVAGTHLRMGEVDLEIVALAEELGADLIVMGSRGLGGVRRALMGSVSDSVVRHAHCPVLVVRPEKGQAA